MSMFAPRAIAAAAALIALAAAGSVAGQPGPQRHSDASAAWHATRQGHLLPLREIERRVVPQMRGWDYIGFDFDGRAAIYTLKFMRDGTVAWVEVDGRSGQVLGRSGR